MNAPVRLRSRVATISAGAVEDAVSVQNEDLPEALENQTLADVFDHDGEGLGAKGEGPRKGHVVGGPTVRKWRGRKDPGPLRHGLGHFRCLHRVGLQRQVPAVLLGASEGEQYGIVVFEVGLDFGPPQIMEPDFHRGFLPRSREGKCQG